MVVDPPAAEHGRERRKRLTRRALRAAALELGLEREWADVSVEAITERAGVSARTFFNYFESKDDAVLIDLLGTTDADLDRFSQGPAASAWDDLVRLFCDDVERAGAESADLQRYVELHERHPALGSRQMAVFARFEARLTTTVAGRLGDGQRLRAQVMAGACITAVRVGLGAWAASGRSGPVRPPVAEAFAVFDPAFRRTT